MPQQSSSCLQAKDKEAIAPLLELCKAGKLFDIQKWIAEGNPVNPPPHPGKGQRRKTPLEYAIDTGFHSIAQILLEAGAIQEPEGLEAPIYRALHKRRYEIVRLLVDHGFDASRIDMDQVFHSWEPDMMSYFIERGADIITGQPLAGALCDRIRTALTVYRQLREKRPELQVQADIALRHHCYEGNTKWVSLLLWAGADPFTPGAVDPNAKEREEDEECYSALIWATIGSHYDIFTLKPIRDKLPGPDGSKLLGHLTRGKGIDILEKLLKQSIDPNDQDNGGSSAIGRFLNCMGWSYSFGYSSYSHRSEGKVLKDNEDSRSQIKGIHLLAKYGAKWCPKDNKEIGQARRDLLTLKPDYTLEFVWIMQKYHACSIESIRELLRTPSIKSHTAAHRERLMQMVNNWNDP